MGKPVVASNIGGPRELVIDGVTGKLCPPADIDAFAEAIIEILTSDETSKRTGEAGYKFARDNFDADKNAGETFLLYEELLNGNR
jgi:glycosyltransferase involved in cell wall biosynthesis